MLLIFFCLFVCLFVCFFVLQGCVEKVKSSVRGHHLLIAISGIIITLIKVCSGRFFFVCLFSNRNEMLLKNSLKHLKTM